MTDNPVSCDVARTLQEDTENTDLSAHPPPGKVVRKAYARSFGTPSQVVAIEHDEVGPLARNHLRLRMSMSAVNPSDLLAIRGTYRWRTPLPYVPGFEGVGTIINAGEGCANVVIGQRVIPIGAAGVWCQIKDHPAADCLVIPANITDLQASCSYVNPLTALVMLRERYRGPSGGRIAVLAAGSAIGNMIVKLALHLNFRVIAFYRSDSAGQRLRSLNITHVQYRTTEELNRICATVSKWRVNAVFDCVGGRAALALASLLEKAGQFIHYGLLSDQSIPMNEWTRRDASFELFHLREWIQTTSKVRIKQMHAEALSLIDSGIFETSIKAIVPFDQIKHALQMADKPSSEGKVVLDLSCP